MGLAVSYIYFRLCKGKKPSRVSKWGMIGPAGLEPTEGARKNKHSNPHTPPFLFVLNRGVCFTKQYTENHRMIQLSKTLIKIYKTSEHCKLNDIINI